MPEKHAKLSVLKLLLLPWLTILVCPNLFSQEVLYDSMLTQVFVVENPVTKPEIALGIGTFNFLGDVKNNFKQPIGGTPGIRINVSTFLDSKNRYKLNIFALRGNLSGSQVLEGNNLNFRTELTNLGASFQYSFGHWLNFKNPLLPFVSAGIETVQFNPKGDLTTASGDQYPWVSDPAFTYNNNIIPRDYVFESNLRLSDLNYTGNYSKSTVAIPLEVGADIRLSPRLFLRLGTSWHFTLSDNIDNLSPGGPLLTTNTRNDWFQYSYFSVHLDPFSEAGTLSLLNLYAEAETDPEMVADEDRDMVFDFYDECPGTPDGVEVDSVGCPLDSDRDGFADYLDSQPNSPAGAMVDAEGVAITGDDVVELFYYGEGVRRGELEYYLLSKMMVRDYIAFRSVGIPATFKEFDVNEDEEISFEELLLAIDRFFDYETFLSMSDIYELIEYFFSQ